MSLLYHLGALPVPPSGFMRTFILFRRCDAPYDRSRRRDTKACVLLCVVLSVVYSSFETRTVLLLFEFKVDRGVLDGMGEA